MLRDTDVPTMMMRVEATLDAAARSPLGARGVMQVAAEGDRRVNVGKARRLAGIEMEFPASSDRAYVGRAVSVMKRVLRRSLRWYLTPMVDQQTRFNHTAVDLFETLRLSVERLARRLDGIDSAATDEGGNMFAGGSNVVEIGDGPAEVDRLHRLDAGSVDGVLAHATTLDAPAAARLVEAAFAALRPGGRVALLTTDEAPVPAAALAWAAEAVGFIHVRQQPAVLPTGSTSLADDLARVARLVRERGLVAVVAVRPGP